MPLLPQSNLVAVALLYSDGSILAAKIRHVFDATASVEDSPEIYERGHVRRILRLEVELAETGEGRAALDLLEDGYVDQRS